MWYDVPVAGLREKLDELEASIQAELSKVGCYIDSFVSLVQLWNPGFLCCRTNSRWKYSFIPPASKNLSV